MKAKMLISMMLFSQIVNGAEVLWDFVSGAQFSSNNRQTILECDLGGGLQVSLFFSTTSSGARSVNVSDVTCNLATAITWLPVLEGAIVDSFKFGDGKVSLYSTEYSGGTGEMDVAMGQPFYLAFQAYELIYDFDPEYGDEISVGQDYYGWVELSSKDGNTMELLASAINLSGNGIIAGAGAVPEPCSGLLVVLGFSLLCLRRRSRRMVTK